MVRALLLVVASAVGYVGLVVGANVCDVPSDETSFLQSHITSKMRRDDPPSPSQSSKLHVDCSKLGPLRALTGTWTSIQGFSMAFGPPDESDIEEGSTYAERVHYYFDTVTFSPLAWPPEISNHGVTIDGESTLDEDVSGLKFEQSVAKDYSFPGYHAETGQFLYNVGPAASDWEVARAGSFGRGMAWLAVGNYSRQPLSDAVREQQETLNGWLDRNFEPQRVEELLFNMASKLDAQNEGINDTKAKLVADGRLGDALQDAAARELRGAGDADALKLHFRTNRDRGMIALPDIDLQVSPEDFTSTFWLLGNRSKPILQYFQNVFFRFGVSKSDSSRLDTACSSLPVPHRCLAKWPHLQFSTLIKVKDDDDCP